jgi:hypothetical protein
MGPFLGAAVAAAAWLELHLSLVACYTSKAARDKHKAARDKHKAARDKHADRKGCRKGM